MLALYRHVNASYNKIHRRNSSNASVLSFRRVEFMMLCFVSLRLCLCLWVLKASHRKEPIALPCVLADNEGWMDYAVYLHPPLCHLSTCLHVAGMSLGLKPYWCECSASVSVYLLLVCLSAPPPPFSLSTATTGWASLPTKHYPVPGGIGGMDASTSEVCWT